MLHRYRRILVVPGAALFSATGLLARLPISMFGLGIVLLVSTVSGSYGLAGAVSATYLVANAVCAIVVGRLIDRLGQARVLAVGSLFCALGMSLLMASVWRHWPAWTMFFAAGVAGATIPPIGSCIRARWSHVLDDPATVQTAYAFEGVVDEVVFMIGPIVVTLLATSVHPLAGIGFAVAAGLLGTYGLATQRRTQPAAHSRTARAHPTAAMPWRVVVPLAVVCMMLGSFFGSAEVVAVAFAEEQGHKAASGLLLAIWALGSLVAGVVTGALHLRSGPGTRVKVGTFALAALMTPLPFIHSIPLMAVALLVAGIAVSPTLIATLTLTEQSVPAARLTEGMSIVQTGLVAGVAPGATVAGYVIDHSGASLAYTVTIGAALIATALARLLPNGHGGHPHQTVAELPA